MRKSNIFIKKKDPTLFSVEQKESCTTVQYFYLFIYFCDFYAARLSPVVDEVWQEQTLLRLLNLVELPLLEGVLQCCQTPPSPHLNTPARSKPDLIYSSNRLDRQILKAFRDSQCVGFENNGLF